MSVESILGQTESNSTQSTSSKYEDKEMFLKLLVAQLSHQDPLNPTDDTEFIAQLAQFTQVEEMQKMNEGMSELVTAYDRQQLVSAASLLGMRVLSGGYTVTKATYEGEPVATPFYYTADQELATCTLTILNPGNGQVVYAEELGSKLSGDHTFNWKGTNNAGQAVPDGVYEIAITATNANGQKVIVDTQVYGDVVLIEKEDGELKLRFSDTRTVNFADVNTVGYVPSNSGEGNNADPENPEDPTGTPPEED